MINELTNAGSEVSISLIPSRIGLPMAREAAQQIVITR